MLERSFRRKAFLKNIKAFVRLLSGLLVLETLNSSSAAICSDPGAWLLDDFIAGFDGFANAAGNSVPIENIHHKRKVGGGKNVLEFFDLAPVQFLLADQNNVHVGVFFRTAGHARAKDAGFAVRNKRRQDAFDFSKMFFPKLNHCAFPARQEGPARL